MTFIATRKSCNTLGCVSTLSLELVLFVRFKTKTRIDLVLMWIHAPSATNWKPAMSVSVFVPRALVPLVHMKGLCEAPVLSANPVAETQPEQVLFSVVRWCG